VQREEETKTKENTLAYPGRQHESVERECKNTHASVALVACAGRSLEKWSGVVIVSVIGMRKDSDVILTA
jgi:hypothetical protein